MPGVHELSANHLLMSTRTNSVSCKPHYKWLILEELPMRVNRMGSIY